jgi:predicted RNA-binding protein YlqC (UPF0109 family)
MNKIKEKIVMFKYSIKDFRRKIRQYLLNKCRDYIYDYEINEVLGITLREAYFGEYLINPDLKVGVLCPETIVHKMLEKYLGFERYLMLRVHGIDIDTKEEDKVTITIKLNKPGLLIGKAGTTLTAIKDMLGGYFKMQTDIRIVEVQELYDPLYII